MKWYKRLTYKQFVQVSGLCGPHFLSYLPKRFTQLCRALFGNAILVDRFRPPLVNNCQRGNRAKERGSLGGRNSQTLRNPLKFAFLSIFGCK